MASAAVVRRIGHAEGGNLLVASSRPEFHKNLLRSIPTEAAAAAMAAGGAEALIKLEEGDYQTLVLDPQIEDLEVDELLATIRERYPNLKVVVPEREKEPQGRDVFSGWREEEAEEKTQDKVEEAGPPKETEEPCGETDEGVAEIAEGSPAQADVATPNIPTEALPGMIGSSRKMQQIYRLARLVAQRDTTVLIVGATGTGKELVARAIHQMSRRSRGPFVTVNCAAIPESLLEAELFGFTRGAFTGAVQSRLGRIHAAHGGTLLLDEVGELPLSMQAKLLRFVQEGEVQRLGSADLFRVDARVVAATNADLLQRVREKQFREDLYYRLVVFPLQLPPLGQRPEDVLPLARHFLRQLCEDARVPQKAFSAEAAKALRKHAWPGNVRELQHWIERAFVLAEANAQIRAEHLYMPEAA